MDGLRTALLIEVPEAEEAVGPERLRLDPLTAMGVPAHVTVLFPFAPAATLDATQLGRLTTLFAATPSFEFTLARTAWFGADVLWLAPEPDSGFRDLTRLVSTAFPEYPPYEGIFEDVVPHLTVGDRGAANEMSAAETRLAGHLPIRSTARSVTLLVEDDARRWLAGASFPLGAPHDAAARTA